MSETITKEQVFERFKKVVYTTTFTEEITEETTLDDDLDMESLDVVELVMECEKEFQIDIPDAQIEGVNTVGQLFEIVWAKLSIQS